MKGGRKSTKTVDTKANKELGKEEEEYTFTKEAEPPTKTGDSEVDADLVPPSFYPSSDRSNNNYEIFQEEGRARGELNTQLYSSFERYNVFPHPVIPANLPSFSHINLSNGPSTLDRFVDRDEGAEEENEDLGMEDVSTIEDETARNEIINLMVSEIPPTRVNEIIQACRKMQNNSKDVSLLRIARRDASVRDVCANVYKAMISSAKLAEVSYENWT